jgi:hypothetical protein
MTVLAIEIEVNGKRLLVAGAKDLALLSAQVAAGVASENTTVGVDTDVHLTVMGLTSPKSSSRMANLTWINGLPLKLGDSISFRIVQVHEADPPANVFRTPTSQELASAAEKERSGLTARSSATRRKRRAPKRER